jgi:malic enzyme
LVEELDIPVMHDDQHGTAIISSAALLNAIELAEKKIENAKIIVSGAGSAALFVQIYMYSWELVRQILSCLIRTEFCLMIEQTCH